MPTPTKLSHYLKYICFILVNGCTSHSTIYIKIDVAQLAEQLLSSSRGKRSVCVCVCVCGVLWSLACCVGVDLRQCQHKQSQTTCSLRAKRLATLQAHLHTIPRLHHPQRWRLSWLTMGGRERNGLCSQTPPTCCRQAGVRETKLQKVHAMIYWIESLPDDLVRMLFCVHASSLRYTKLVSS